MIQLRRSILIILSISFQYVAADYWNDRNQILANEAAQLTGSSIVLSEDEQKANGILMTLKLKEHDNGFQNPSTFLPSKHFFHGKEQMEQSEVFQFIKKLPKGASLHSHTSAMLSTDKFFQLTYLDGLYGCDNNGTFNLNFFFNKTDDTCNWKLLSEWRNQNSTFDDFLKKKFTIVIDNPEIEYSDINVAWTHFQNIFSVTSSLFSYKQFLHDYLIQTMEEFYDDNIRYMEIRSSFGQIFDASNRQYSETETCQFFLDTIAEFKSTHTDFIGLRVIYSKNRNADNVTMQQYIDKFLKFQNQFPDFVVGFDLVGQEDIGQPLSNFADYFSTILNETKFFFHAGETNWYGTNSDDNLVDAILLNTSRIGHGFAITKHPEVLKLVKERNIAIEINPISNQVLKLVADMRNHVGVTLIANDFPIVITPDDPSFWGAKGVSYDWYMLFMGMTPRNGDLKILKQLAWNSLRYSALDQKAMNSALTLLEGWWNSFIQDVLQQYKHLL